jgi:hypothetical protein
MWDVGCGMWDVGCGMWDVGGIQVIGGGEYQQSPAVSQRWCVVRAERREEVGREERRDMVFMRLSGHDCCAPNLACVRSRVRAKDCCFSPGPSSSSSFSLYLSPFHILLSFLSFPSYPLSTFHLPHFLFPLYFFSISSPFLPFLPFSLLLFHFSIVNFAKVFECHCFK